MFGPRFNEQKLKVNLGLVVTRLKLIEKKKTDQGLRARPEIAEYVRNAKPDRARVRVESIIREDYLVEAMELVEMYADLLAGRIGLIKQSKVLDESLKTPISTLIWATPRLSQYCQELRVVTNLLSAYYGKKYVEACMSNQVGTVCERVQTKLDPSPPKKILVEQYLIEICKTANVDFTPDPRVMNEELEESRPNADLLDFNQGYIGPGGPGDNSSGGCGGGAGGGGGGQLPSFSYAAAANAQFEQPTYNPAAQAPFKPPAQAPYNPPAQAPYNPGHQGFTPQPAQQPINLPPYSPTDPIQEDKQAPPLPTKNPAGPKDESQHLPSYNESLETPGSSSQQDPVAAPRNSFPGIPNLPSVPTSNPGNKPAPGAGNTNQDNNDDFDFDDLSRRFENLRKKT